MLLASTSHILNQNLIMICFPHIQALCDMSPDGLRARHMTRPLQNQRLKYDETIIIPLRSQNPRSYLASTRSNCLPTLRHGVL